MLKKQNETANQEEILKKIVTLDKIGNKSLLLVRNIVQTNVKKFQIYFYLF